ncbi:MAG: DNA translocase FtsK [Candidatus Omnitrophica bacterium]|nr:DNA translocase FtsK [Candidatus Omnitrophota bacterium]
MKQRRINEIKAVILVALGLIILASLISFTPFDLSFYTSSPNTPPKNFIHTFGAYLAGIVLFLFGKSSLFIPLFIFWIGLRFFQQRNVEMRLIRIIGILFFLLSTSSLFGLFFLKDEAKSFGYAGFFGFFIAKFINNYFGSLGGYIILTSLTILGLILFTEVLLSNLFLSIIDKTRHIFKPIFKLRKLSRLCLKEDSLLSIKKEHFTPPIMEKSEQNLKKAPEIKPKIQIKIKPRSLEPQGKKSSEPKSGEYQLPSLDLLDSPPPLEARQIKEDLTSNARILEETLEDFGISAKVTNIERGPVITLYELEPAPGVKLNRIVALSDDIALSLKAQSVRIIAPIPGKGRVGVEVPNTQSSFVYLKEVLASKEFQTAKSKLTLALGKDIAGEPVIADLDEMPHLLIAGTTGSGKTVCVNSIILTLLFRNTPQDLRFLMIDPKMVELANFNDLPHLLCPVVTEAKKAYIVLNWVVNEMEQRYRLLAKVGARNIEAYNEKQEKLPYIVVVIDEFADLMSVSSEQVENAVTRLAQLSRAVGIHLILATQRPSVDVVTGVIKANLPARISFKVASKVDSRTVLDMNGADKLLGKGDMLFLRPGESKLIRAQGCLVTDNEIVRVVDFIKSQSETLYDEEILKEQARPSLIEGVKDELYDEAVRVIMESNQASVSILQRRMRLGYTRAARIIDMMEQEGLIGPFEGSRPRKILVDREAWLKDLAKKKEEFSKQDGI